MPFSRIFCVPFFCFIAFLNQTLPAYCQEAWVGSWEAAIQCPGGDIEFGIEFENMDGTLAAFLVNGKERIKVPKVEATSSEAKLVIDHYDSTLDLSVVRVQDGTGILSGVWKKRRSKDDWLVMNVSGSEGQSVDDKSGAAKKFTGRWAVDFSSTDDPAVGIFSVGERGDLQGTFLTTTGDYRYLSGPIDGEEMTLSCFDGAHAFLFKAKLQSDGTLKGDFWSSDRWHETFTAKHDQAATLPNEFKATMVNQTVKLGDFEFPSVDGTMVNLDGPEFKGKPRVIYVFGSWCPNCHDAAAYFSQLDKKYKDRGLSIMGIAFELTGDFDRDADQVKKYMERNECTYPVVIAGTSDKKHASRTFPLLDRIRAYPTSIFIDKNGKVVAIHTGFSGPATGESHKMLQKRFEGFVEMMLNSN